MSYLLYEVWADDGTGQEELIDTTASPKEAETLAKKSLDEGYEKVVIYKETEDGDSVVIKRLQNSTA